jgi:3-deoxy-D-manno-octulosonate 8-phosphate phosphatase (KDO 8-P phosphatase)
VPQKKPPKKLLQKLRLLVLDVDGTLTDGRLYYGPQGEAMKVFDVRDGHALRMLPLLGIKTAVLTGRRADLAMQRCKELGIEYAIGHSRDKAAGIAELCKNAGVALSETAFMGDDTNDLPAMRIAAFSAAPRDAAAEVVKEVHWVSNKDGGRGAVRELCELILAARGEWPPRD